MEVDTNALTLDDVELILESLRYTRLKDLRATEWWQPVRRTPEYVRQLG